MAITSRDYIIINGKNSNDVGLYVDTPPMPSKPEREYTSISIPGRPEPLAIKKVNRAERQVDLNCYLFDDEAYDPDELYAYLESGETLITSKSSRYYYKVNSLLQIVPTYQGHGKQYLQISFMCSPYRYAVNNEPETINRSGSMVDVTGTEYCQPQYTIYGNGDITLTVAETKEPLVIYGVEGIAVVDTNAMIVHKDGVPYRNKGKLPFMAIGSNKVEWKGNVSKIEIVKNERWI